MRDGDGDPSVARVVVPVHAVKLRDDVRLVLEEEVSLDGTRVAAAAKEDETTMAIGTQLAEVYVDGLVRCALELAVELDRLGIRFVAHDSLHAGVDD